MLHKLTSTAFENVMMKLTMKQKQFIYQIAKLEYRIQTALMKLENVTILIREEEENISSLKAAIEAAGKGKVTDKLMIWKTKAEYKLFKLNLRKSKIDLIKLAINQSKLGQLKQALASLEKDITGLEAQGKALTTNVKEVEISAKNDGLITLLKRSQRLNEQDPINQSIREFLKEALKMAS